MELISKRITEYDYTYPLKHSDYNIATLKEYRLFRCLFCFRFIFLKEGGRKQDL